MSKPVLLLPRQRPRSMVTRQSLPAHRSRIREAIEVALFLVLFLGMVLVLSLEGVQ